MGCERFYLKIWNASGTKMRCAATCRSIELGLTAPFFLWISYKTAIRRLIAMSCDSFVLARRKTRYLNSLLSADHDLLVA
jgi:hypothetical protein